jgi:putative SOS response-associated peptidase YedK
MCGLYRLSRRKQILAEHFDTADWQDDRSPRYNIAPTQSVPVVRQHPKESVRQLSLMKWGLIPHWASDPAIATRAINAKSETAATKPAFYHDRQNFNFLIPPALAPQQLRQLYRVSGSSPLVDRYFLRSPWVHFQ